MEVAVLSDSSLRIKSKKSSLVVDPKPKMPKTSADAILLLGEADTSKVEEYRLLINDDGEYEVGGIKITGQSKDSGIFYNLNVDSSQIFLSKVSTLEKMADMPSEAEIAVLNVDANLNESIIASLEAKVIVLYGEKTQEGLKALGKTDLSPAKKFVAAKDKLTEAAETQIVWLA